MGLALTGEWELSHKGESGKSQVLGWPCCCAEDRTGLWEGAYQVEITSQSSSRFSPTNNSALMEQKYKTNSWEQRIAEAQASEE